MLEIEPLQKDHLAELAGALRLPDVYKHIGGVVPSLADFVEGLRRALSGPPSSRPNEYWRNYLIRLADSGRMIGRLEATIVADRAEVAFLLTPSAWGFGYGAQGLSWLERSVDEEFRVGSFWATTLPANTNCRRLLKRGGYQAVKSIAAPKLASYDPGDLVYCKVSQNHGSGAVGSGSYSPTV